MTPGGPTTTQPSQAQDGGIHGPGECPRLRFILVTLILAVGLDVLAAVLDLGWQAAASITFGLNLVLLGFIFVRRDRLLGQLFIFGVVAGFMELPSDYYSVSVINALVYTHGGWFIWKSPFYMPFSYIVVLVQIGYLGYWLTGRFGLWPACLLTGLLGGLNVPLYEYLAKYAGYWHYRNCRMILEAVPYYIIAGEFLFAFVLPLLVGWFARARWPTIVLLGLLEGIWMFIAWAGSYQITG
jgi:hypothetical protein